ncbi:plasmid stabilization protein [Methanomicrobium antiquum]|uniref:Plasmid stabilization protein n=1 Tax=Methanomicrobium antiquum TaxID=487686 RepID=A0AAF0JMH2_9EURY|nr:plasmid stabilization protein [Methanomicrobium antiquum]MDD3977863.1 plasmid stabilization protein [Methanomicrobium sp.]WFN36535.1 plasmid stabilization protein [Methanomicrobium antiquum]
MHDIIFSDDVLKYISNVPKKDKTHIKEIILLCLGEYLKKTTKRCNKKLLKGSNPKTYRLHISMAHTFFYWIDEEKQSVKIVKAMGINQAHSRYKRS